MSTCDRCGKCCKRPVTVNLQAMPEDIDRWIDEGRQDILLYVEPFDMPDFDRFSCDIWVDPIIGEDFIDCPFLQKNNGHGNYTCLIHDTKPYNCCVYNCKNKEWIDQIDV